MTDKQGFAIYFAVRLAALACFGAGLWALTRDHQAIGLVTMLVGAAGFFIRPRHILPRR